MRTTSTTSAVAFLLAAATPVLAQTSITGGTGGSAAAGGTSRFHCRARVAPPPLRRAAPARRSRPAESAAAVDGKAKTGVSTNKGNGPVMNSNARAQAHEGGTFSRSHTRTKVKAGEEVGSTTKTMSHVPGSKPTMSRTTTTAR